MTFSVHGSATGGYAVGPVENAFEGVDLAAAQAARDAYFASNPTKLAAYDSNPFYLIRLTYGATTNAEYRMGGQWIDYTPFLQGLPGEVASLANVPVGELPYKTLDGTFAGSRMRVLDDGSLLAPPGFGVESGSVKFGDVLLLSEAAGFLSISNLINERPYTILDYYTPRDAASAVPTAFMASAPAFGFVAQPDDSVNMTDEPLLFDYTIQNTSRTYSLFMRAFAAMSNVRIKITQISNGVALKYLPSKEAWETEEGGLEWIIGDNTFDFGDTPLIFNTGQNIRFEIRATTMSLKGNASGIPYFGGSDQLGEFRDVLMADQYTATDVRDKLATLTGTNRLPMSAIKDGVVSVAGRLGAIVLTASDVAGLSTVATTGAYSSLSGLPFIPTNTSQLTNGANFITAAQAPVQSVQGYTGAVVLARSDIGLGNVDNTSDINKPTSTAQQTSIDVKMSQHNAAVDPHPQYTTVAEASAAAPIQSIVNGRGITASTLTGVTTVGSTEFPLVFNGSGAASSPKIWYGTATSDVNGVFIVDISSAGFTLAPTVTVSATLTTVTLTDRAWATLASVTATTASGYTLRGINLSGNGATVRLAPNTTVNIMAIGI
ncbi:tail fiber protein [Pseudomonas phage phiPsa374]|uniref:Tail fiber protein n=5 Tax=Otagovirus TaxID=2560197 RepID=A0A7G9V180_9CAUD|nr:minor tail protein [Pseudomonas phage phiPsa374]YP_010767148.1 tail fiber protein [Pseudomonas phage phiPsa397]YP_010767494.1 putative SGNH hydrolase [Pseudomonas phage phiPsa347]YP_010767844.1 tail fiber protein [Pseudomonas phage phiPsa300]YP_010768016.1 putative SGNH hydrolase [Pseudomonas phage phiPsa315]AHJ87314.1 tail fiber protein [Pseudomonas phage phiPsa374]QNO00036.1 tail fiber protein [Pseudomonas phage phiPsa300]QNO00207.1 putative SGNH hydrolase [Pseudomonas phage phiPsa315]